jgi:hypothetical protein
LGEWSPRIGKLVLAANAYMLLANPNTTALFLPVDPCRLPKSFVCALCPPSISLKTCLSPPALPSSDAKSSTRPEQTRSWVRFNKDCVACRQPAQPADQLVSSAMRYSDNSGILIAIYGETWLSLFFPSPSNLTGVAGKTGLLHTWFHGIRSDTQTSKLYIIEV